MLTVDVQPPTLPLNSADMTISAVIAGPTSSNGSSPVTFGLTKVDGGTLQLTGNNTYTGPTTVSAGFLQVDGTQTASPVTVNAGGVVTNGVGAAVLSGTGTLGAVTATNGGTVNPGDPATGIGILTASSLNLTQTGGKGGIVEIEITGTFAYPGTPGVNYDQLNLGTGALTLDTTSALTFDLNGLQQDVQPPGVPVVLYGTLPGTQAWSNVSAINNTFLSFTAAVQTLPQQTNVIISAPATHIVIQGTPANATAGFAFNISVVAQDQFNNQAYGYLGTVHFATTDSNVNVSLPPNSALSSGLGVFAATLITAGTQSISVNDVNTTSISGTVPVIVVPGPPAHYLVAGPTTAVAGHLIIQTVTVQDLYNNTVTGYTGTLHFTSSDPKAVMADNETLTAGVGFFSVFFETAGIQATTATDTTASTLTGSSDSITVSPGALTHFGIAVPPTAPAGIGVIITVTAEDQFNNAVTGYTGTVNLTSSDSVQPLQPPKRPAVVQRLGHLRRHSGFGGYADNLRYR